MAYSLNNALTDLKRTFVWQINSISYEPLVGVVDGINRIFQLRYAPVADVVMYNSSLTAFSTGYTLNSGTGVLVFDSPPTTPNYASYTAQQFSDAQILDICKSGFYEFTARYSVEWYLVASGGSDFISSSLSTVVDPTITGSVAFSQSPRQINALTLASEYFYTLSQWIYGSGQYYRYREQRSGGLEIDRSRLNDALAKATEFLSKRLDEAILLAGVELGRPFAVWIPPKHTQVYERFFEWQSCAESITVCN